MGTSKYYLDDKTGEYVKKRNNLFIMIVSHLLFGGTMSLICAKGYSKYFESQKVTILKQHNEQLQHNIENLSKVVDDSRILLARLKDTDCNLYRILLSAEPQQVSPKLVNDVIPNIQLDNITPALQDLKNKLNVMYSEMMERERSYIDLQNRVKTQRKTLKSLPSILPSKGRITSGYGPRLHPIYNIVRQHNGIDIAASKGSPIYATGDGVVKVVRDAGNRGHGKYVIINHSGTLSTLYAHMYRIIVKPGMKIKRGQTIGYMGSSGLSTGPHVHYEVIKYNKPVNPISYIIDDISPREYEEIVRQANASTASLD